MGLVTAELSEHQFHKICGLVYDTSGIKLKKGKEALVRARLMKRLRALQIGNISEYLKLIESGSGAIELDALIDVMTTNKTSFFRRDRAFPLFARHDITRPGRSPIAVLECGMLIGRRAILAGDAPAAKPCESFRA